MRSDKENSIINSVMFGIAFAFFVVWVFISEKNFSDSLIINFLSLLLMAVGSFFIGNVIIGLPIVIIYYLTTYSFEDFYDLSGKKRFFIVSIVVLMICVLITFMVTK